MRLEIEKALNQLDTGVKAIVGSENGSKRRVVRRKSLRLQIHFKHSALLQGSCNLREQSGGALERLAASLFGSGFGQLTRYIILNRQTNGVKPVNRPVSEPLQNFETPRGPPPIKMDIRMNRFMIIF